MATADEKWIPIVVRFTRYDSVDDPELLVEVMKAFRTSDQAEAEAERLNQAAAENPRLNGKVHYFVKFARDERGS